MVKNMETIVFSIFIPHDWVAWELHNTKPTYICPNTLGNFFFQQTVLVIWKNICFYTTLFWEIFKYAKFSNILVLFTLIV